MAGGQERVLRRRIRSVQATKKITRAMGEFIAASQIVRAQGRIAAASAYQQGIASVFEEAVLDAGEHAGRMVGSVASPERVLVLAIVGDRGLCGGYNANVLRTLERTVRAGRASGVAYRVISTGRKAPPFLRFRGIPAEQSFIGFSERPTFEDARAVAAAVIPPFTAEEVDQVLVVSTRFLSAGSQQVQTRQLLPAPPPTDVVVDEPVTEAPGGTPTTPGGHAGFTEFEPDAVELLESLVPRYAEASIFGALLEGAASELTARQRAMAAATENADELIKTLSRVMNRARQDAITTEIMEIVGGAEALRQSADVE